MGGTCSGRPKRPPTITLAPGLTLCRTCPEIRIRVANGTGRAGREADDVLLVPDLPSPDREVPSPGFPPRSHRARIVRPLAQERGPGPALQGASDGRSTVSGRHPVRRAGDERHHPDPGFGGQSTSWSNPPPVGDRRRYGYLRLRSPTSRAAAEHFRCWLPAISSKSELFAGALRGDSDEARAAGRPALPPGNASSAKKSEKWETCGALSSAGNRGPRAK